MKILCFSTEWWVRVDHITLDIWVTGGETLGRIISFDIEEEIKSIEEFYL